MVDFCVGHPFAPVWLILLGSGVIGGVAWGWVASPRCSTLIKWFPDRRSMATGIAIIGFSGGAMIGLTAGSWPDRSISRRPMSA
jgi:predicted MFS family arabinose efflux permease